MGTVKAQCPACDGERVCNVHGQAEKRWEWSDKKHAYSVDGGVTHSLLECRGCEAVFYQKASWNSEDVHYYYDGDGKEAMESALTYETFPKADAKDRLLWISKIDNVDSQLALIISEMYSAYSSGLCILTAQGLRTALDRSTEVLGIDPAITFDEKLNALKAGGWIGDTERDVLGVVTDAGSAAAHRGWSPDQSELSHLITALELFLQKAFILGTGPLALKTSIPEKPKRRQVTKPKRDAEK